MIPYDTDPSLHASEPEPTALEDGFSPPHRVEPHVAAASHVAAESPSAPDQVNPELGVKSPF
jgi:hypothetical protein